MRISVVIPTYNYAKYVTEAVDSALDQVCPPYEVIVVDDGSTDDTRDRIAMYGNRVRYIFQRNQGLSAARNTGVAAATGDAVALLDSDDAFHPRKLELQVAYLKANPAVGLVGTGLFTDRAYIWPEVNTAPAILLSLNAHVLRTRFCPSSAVFRRALWETVGEFDPSVSGAADRDYWIRSAARWNVAMLHSPLTYYREHPGAMNRNAIMMIAHERAVLDKAFTMPELRDEFWLRRRAYGLAALSAAYMYHRDAGNIRAAARAYIDSFRHWPLPFGRSDTRCRLYRLRFGIRLAREMVRYR